MDFRKNKIFYSVFSFFIILNIILIFKTRLFPFVDIPQHLSYATIHRCYNSSTNYFSEFFKIYPLFFKWNSLHPLICSMKIWPGVEFGNRIFLSLYVILLPSSVLYFIKKIDGNIWLTLLSFLLIYNLNVSWGFVGFFFAIPLCIFALAVNLENIRNNSLKDKWILGFLLILIYHSHILPLLTVIPVLIIQNIIHNKNNLKNFLKSSIPHLVGVFLLLYFAYLFPSLKDSVSGAESGANSTHRSLLNIVSSNFGINVWSTLKQIPQRLKTMCFMDFSYLSKGRKGTLVGLGFFIAIFSPFIIGLFKQNNTLQSDKNKNAITIILITIFYYLLVYSIYPGSQLDWQRYSVFLFILIIILSSKFVPKKDIKFKLLVIPLCIIYFALVADYIFEFNKINKNFDKSLFKGIPKNKVVSGLMIENFYRGEAYRYNFFPEYHIVWNKGIETTRMSNALPYYQIDRKVSKEVIPNYFDHMWRYRIYPERYNNVDYILMRGAVEDFSTDESEEVFQNNFKKFRERGIWKLYKHKRLY